MMLGALHALVFGFRTRTPSSATKMGEMSGPEPSPNAIGQSFNNSYPVAQMTSEDKWRHYTIVNRQIQGATGIHNQLMGAAGRQNPLLVNHRDIAVVTPVDPAVEELWQVYGEDIPPAANAGIVSATAGAFYPGSKKKSIYVPLHFNASLTIYNPKSIL